MEGELHAIANSRRRAMLELVLDRELPAGEIADLTGLSRPATSQHLRVLREAGLVEARAEGNRRLYYARAETLAELRAALEGLWTGQGHAAEHPERGGPMSIDVTAETRIRRPRGEVARYVVDPAHDPDWIGGVREACLLGDPPLGAGSRVARVASFLGRRIEYVNEVVELESERRLVMESVEGPFPMHITYEFADGDGGTIVRNRVRGDPGGAAPVCAALDSARRGAAARPARAGRLRADEARARRAGLDLMSTLRGGPIFVLASFDPRPHRG
jgi:DNA-binding transcriptional ArsR family regulator